MSLPPEELSQHLANLNLNSGITNNSVVSSSLTTNQQFQHPSNTHSSYDSTHSATQVFAGTTQIMSANNFDYSPSIPLELESLKTTPATCLIIYAQTDLGSRMLQNILKMRKPEFTEVIFEKVITISERRISYIFDLMIGQHGWYVLVKLIDACNEQQLETIVTVITWNTDTFIQHSLTKYGSCSLMKLIKALKKSHLVDRVVTKLGVQFCNLMTQKYGLYILTECLDQLDERQNQLLYICAIVYCLPLATHKQGCISLNTIVEKVCGPLRASLINIICNNAVFLAFDPSGNYVVQKVLDLENPIFTYTITENLRGKYASLSKQKAGSHLVEKCLNSTGMLTVVEDLINSNQVVSVAEDKYGNYVIQTALRVSKRRGSSIHSSLVGCLYPYRDKLQHGYGRNVRNAIVEENSSVQK